VKQLHEPTDEQLNKRYESFLYFVTLTVLIRILPLIESIIDNNFFLLISMVVSFVIIRTIIANSKIHLGLRKICERLNISIVFLYIWYIIIYVVLFMFIFKLT
jgi:hypothetical protein